VNKQPRVEKVSVPRVIAEEMEQYFTDAFDEERNKAGWSVKAYALYYYVEVIARALDEKSEVQP
jgi:hypothetical protein